MAKPQGLSKDVLKISVTRFFAFGLSLIIPIVLTHYLTQDEYGSYRQLILLFSTLQPIFLFGMPTSLRFFIPRADKKEAGIFVIQNTIFIFVSGLILFFIISITGGPISVLLFGNDLTTYMLLLGAHAFLFMGSSFLGLLLIVNDDVNLAAVIAVVFAILDVFIMCGATIIYRSLEGLMIGIILASFIKYCVTIIYISRNFKFGKIIIDKPRFRAQIKYALPFGLASIVGIININVDKYFISFFLDPEVFAVYSIGAYLAPIILVVQRSVTDIITPRMSYLHKHNRLEDIRVLWHESIRKLGLILFAITAFLLIAARDVISIFFPEAYILAASVLMIYLLLLPIGVTYYASIFMATGRTAIIFKVSVITLALNFFANYAFIQLFDMMGFNIIFGPPVATVLVTYVVAFVFISSIRYELNTDFENVFPWGEVGKLALIALIAGAVTYLVYFYLAPLLPLIRVVVAGLIFLALYISLAVWLKSFTKGDWELVKAIFGRGD